MFERSDALRELSSRVYDAVIVGGGITGAGVARDAALRGMTVALVEKGDFASGTSSRSSRLIHGGVRYLEHGHLHLVFEASAERRRLLQLAPSLVRPQPFIWPVYAGQRLPLWKIATGLTLYDALALFRNVERHRRLSANEVLQLEPALRRDGLVGGVRYFDASTNDTRLTLANVLDARRAGATVANHAAFLSAARGRDRLFTVSIEDVLTGERIEVRTRAVVNASGPWSDEVTGRMSAAPTPRQVRGSKGAHIAVKRERVGNAAALTLQHPRDGRVMFTLPGATHTIIGTTDTYTTSSPDEVRAAEVDVAYLLAAAATFFPDARLSREDVVSAWAGIRPLLPTSGSSVAATREHAITIHDGVISVTGGKLTTYRVMAAQVVDAVRRELAMPRRRAVTGQRPLPDATTSANASPAERAIEVGLPYSIEDARRAVQEELACTLGDILIRRTHVAFETRDNGRAAARRVADLVAPLLGWDATTRERELKRYDLEVARIFSIDS